MWPGVQPGRNTFNSTYIDKIEEIVDALGEKGIYSLLDMHQVISSVLFLTVRTCFLENSVERVLLTGLLKSLIRSCHFLTLPWCMNCLLNLIQVTPKSKRVSFNPFCVVDTLAAWITLSPGSISPWPLGQLSKASMIMLMAFKPPLAISGSMWPRSFRITKTLWVSTAYRPSKFVLNFDKGYELINEPWPGDIYEHPSLILQGGAADIKNLQPLYDYLK